jgi:hypothetical protein
MNGIMASIINTAPNVVNIMGDWLGAALLGIVGSSADDSTDPVTGARDGDGTTRPNDERGSTGRINASGTLGTAGTEIEAAPAIDDEPVFTARSEE